MLKEIESSSKDLQRMLKFNSDVMHMMVPLIAESGTVVIRSNVMNMTVHKCVYERAQECV